MTTTAATAPWTKTWVRIRLADARSSSVSCSAIIAQSVPRNEIGR